MLFSRFWMVLLALVAGASVAAMTLARKTYDHDRATDVATMVDSDRRIVEEFLRRDARTRLDDIGPVSSDASLVALMVTATRRTADTPAVIGTAITTRLRELNQGLGPLRGEVILSGGLTPANVRDAVQQLRPWAVDVSSGVERSSGPKGVKDPGLIERFIEEVHLADV